MNLFLLQGGAGVYFAKDDPKSAVIVGICVGVLVLILTVKSIVQRALGGGGSSGKSSGSGGAPKRISVFAMRRMARNYGFNREQTKTLEYVLRTGGVVDPERIVNNASALDKHFRRAFKQIENGAGSEEEAQQKMALLFSVRNVIDIQQNISGSGAETQKISPGMSAVLSVNQDTYPVKVISVKGDSLLVDCPRNSAGILIQFPKGTRVNIAFFTKSSKGYSFDSQITGIGATSYGPALQILHAQQAKAMTQRRFRRQQAMISCDFFTIRLEAVKGKKPPKMIVDPKRLPGSVTDISIGGCAIKTSLSIPPGSRLKIEFYYARLGQPVAVLGQVLRVNRSGITSSIVHIKFLKVPRKAMNAINFIVFEYGD